MKTRALLCVVLALSVAPMMSSAATKTKSGAADKAKPAPAATSETAKAPAMDSKAMEEMYAKVAAPGPQHEKLKKLEGTWNLTVKSSFDPSKPPEVTNGTAVITMLMDGRYCQEVVSGTQMGKPFSGFSITGYDNVQKKYVSSWVDNMGTGIMTSEGTADESGNLNWTASMADPMSGQMAKYRMVTRFVNDNQHVFEMYGPGPDGKELKAVEITYDRKTEAAANK